MISRNLIKVVIAPDSFKGCLSSAGVAEAVAEGINEVIPDADLVTVPVADGGEGTVDALVSGGNGDARIVWATVSDPLGRPVRASYGIVGKTAIIESAASCGLVLLKPEERNPLLTTTRGLGEMILHAIGLGCDEFLVGLGGSATNDGGRGMIEMPGFLEAAQGLKFTVACDVNTPFVGPFGASRVFGPQKGASPEDVEILEKRLEDYSEKILEDTGVDVRQMSGAGAAGGLGGAFHAYLGASLRRGVDMILDFIGFDDRLKGASLVITGEGRSDFQTPAGKTPAGVLERAKRRGIPVVLLSGAVARCPELESLGFIELMAATPPDTPVELAVREDVARRNLRAAAAAIAKKYLKRNE